MTWSAQELFIAVFVRPAGRQWDDVVDLLADRYATHALALLAQVAVALPDALAISDACAAPLALDRGRWHGFQPGRAQRLEARLEGAKLHDLATTDAMAR